MKKILQNGKIRKFAVIAIALALALSSCVLAFADNSQTGGMRMPGGLPAMGGMGMPSGGAQGMPNQMGSMGQPSDDMTPPEMPESQPSDDMTPPEKPEGQPSDDMTPSETPQDVPQNMPQDMDTEREDMTPPEDVDAEPGENVPAKPETDEDTETTSQSAIQRKAPVNKQLNGKSEAEESEETTESFEEAETFNEVLTTYWDKLVKFFKSFFK